MLIMETRYLAIQSFMSYDVYLSSFYVSCHEGQQHVNGVLVLFYSLKNVIAWNIDIPFVSLCMFSCSSIISLTESQLLNPKSTTH